MGKPHMVVKHGVLYQDIRNKLRSFDMVFFKGVDLTSSIIRVLQHRNMKVPDYGDFSHVGMIVRYDMLKKIFPDNKDITEDGVYIWEAGIGGKFGCDVYSIDGKAILGVQLRKFDDVMREYDKSPFTEIAIGTLINNPVNKYKPTDAKYKDYMENLGDKFKVIYEDYGKANYDINIFSLAGAIDPKIRPFAGKLEKFLETQKWYFCSELLANVYKDLQVYPKEVDPRHVVPRDLVYPGADIDKTPKILNRLTYVTTDIHYVEGISNLEYIVNEHELIRNEGIVVPVSATINEEERAIRIEKSRTQLNLERKVSEIKETFKDEEETPAEETTTTEEGVVLEEAKIEEVEEPKEVPKNDSLSDIKNKMKERQRAVQIIKPLPSPKTPVSQPIVSPKTHKQAVSQGSMSTIKDSMLVEIKKQILTLSKEERDQIKNDIRDELYEELKPSLTKSIGMDLKTPLKTQIQKEIQTPLKTEIKQSIKTTIKDEVKVELQDEIIRDIKTSIKTDLTNSIKMSLKPEITKVVNDEATKKEIQEELMKEVLPELKAMMRTDMEVELREEIKKEFTQDKCEEIAKKIYEEEVETFKQMVLNTVLENVKSNVDIKEISDEVISSTVKDLKDIIKETVQRELEEEIKSM